ncbi:MAG TPA: hypothetical protein IAD08_04055 [Candidatus Scatovivens faecipullorum]|nr:hypothetical protein [Candidatus Scatovivens faecipullorum]
MSVVITLEDIQAYAEVDYIINHMNQKYKEKVPPKMLAFFSELKDPNHVVKINPYVPLQNQGLKRYTLEIIALLHLKYWCEDEERKKELYNIMLRNQEKLEEQMRDRYSVEKLFDNTSETASENDKDTEKEDFTKPRVVQRYSQYTQDNTDIQDYTDHVEVSNNQEESKELISENKLEIAKNIFQKIFAKIQSIFKKA